MRKSRWQGDNIEKTDGISCHAVYSRNEDSARRLAEKYEVAAAGACSTRKKRQFFADDAVSGTLCGDAWKAIFRMFCPGAGKEKRRC